MKHNQLPLFAPQVCAPACMQLATTAYLLTILIFLFNHL